MSPPAWRGTRNGSAATIASGSRTGQRRKATASAADDREPDHDRGRRSRAVSSRRSTIWLGVPLVAEDQDREEDDRDQHRRRAGAAGGEQDRRGAGAGRDEDAGAGQEVAQGALLASLLAPARRPSRRAVQPDRAGRDQVAFLIEQLDPQLVAARGGDAAAAPAAVPVEGEEVVALEEPVAGEGDDDLAARLDDLDGRVVGAG